jgi:hypothetical protein
MALLEAGAVSRCLCVRKQARLVVRLDEILFQVFVYTRN